MTGKFDGKARALMPFALNGYAKNGNNQNNARIREILTKMD